MSVVFLLLWHLCLYLWRTCCQPLAILLPSPSDALVTIFFNIWRTMNLDDFCCTNLCPHTSSLTLNRLALVHLSTGVESQVQQDIQGLPLTSDALHLPLQDWRCSPASLDASPIQWLLLLKVIWRKFHCCVSTRWPMMGLSHWKVVISLSFVSFCTSRLSL